MVVLLVISVGLIGCVTTGSNGQRTRVKKSGDQYPQFPSEDVVVKVEGSSEAEQKSRTEAANAPEAKNSVTIILYNDTSSDPLTVIIMSEAADKMEIKIPSKQPFPIVLKNDTKNSKSFFVYAVNPVKPLAILKYEIVVPANCNFNTKELPFYEKGALMPRLPSRSTGNISIPQAVQ